MKIESNLIGPLLQKFFVDYLSNQKRVSPETIGSYRDMFRLLLRFMKEEHRARMRFAPPGRNLIWFWYVCYCCLRRKTAV